MQPMPQPATAATDDVAALREQLRSLRDRDGWSNSRIAQELGVGASTVSQLISGKYAARDQRQLWKNVSRLLETLSGDRSMVVPLASHIDTPISRRITEACAWAHNHGDISLVYGLAGAGKTWAVRRYADQRSGVNYVSATPTCASVPAFLALLARALGVSARGWAPKVEAQIIDSLAGSTPRLLVIDEAHHLPQQVIDEARCIYDSVGQAGTAPFGLVLVGNDPLRATLMGAARCAQIVSRIGRTVHLTSLSSADINSVVKCLTNNPDKKLEEAAKATAAGPGALRRLVKVGRDAVALAAAEDRQQPTAADLKAAEQVRVG